MKLRQIRPVIALAAVLLSATVAISAAQSVRTLYDSRTTFQRLTVREAGGIRQLIFDGKFDGSDAIQSEMNVANPTQLTLAYSQHMIAALPLVEKPKRILVIGLGGACIQRYLYQYLPETIIESAELDPVVVQVAVRYFNLKPDNRQIVHTGDGRKFIELSKDKYDIIMLDAFSATSIPYSLSTKEFLEACKSHLTENGIVAANLWYEPPTYHDMLKTYAAVFPEWHVLRCPQSINNILVAMPNKRGLTDQKWKELAKTFEQARPTTLDLPKLIDYAYQPDIRIPDAAKVLLDKDERK